MPGGESYRIKRERVQCVCGFWVFLEVVCGEEVDGRGELGRRVEGFLDSLVRLGVCYFLDSMLGVCSFLSLVVGGTLP